jgi:large subunit ribosomal protein L9
VRVVLRKDVPGLGKRGEVKDVADGYAQNFLFPRGLATDANAGELKRVAEARAHERSKKDRQHRDAEELAERLGATPLSFKLKVGPQGKAFGSVTDRDIVDALKRKGFEVPREQIHLEEPLRSTGVHAVEVRLQSDVRAKLTIAVEPE